MEKKNKMMSIICSCLEEPEWCCGLNRWGCGETHVGVKVGVERSPDLHFLFSFLCVFYIQVITLLATQPLAFVSGQEWVAKSIEREIAYTHMSDIHAFVCQAAFVYVSTVCIVGAEALLSQPITFTSTPNLSWVSRVRVKAGEVATRKWLLPHHKWEKSRGNGSGKVAVVLHRGLSETARMRRKKKCNK